MTDVHQYVDGNAGKQYWSFGDGGRKHSFITSKGVMFATCLDSAAGVAFYRSTNNGTTWQYVFSLNQGQVTSGSSYSVYCDEYDNLHFIFAHYFGAASDGRTDKTHIQYRHTYMLSDGVNTAAWSPEFTLTGYDFYGCPDVTAHGHNGQIRVHFALHYNWAGDNRHITYYGRAIININDNANHVWETNGLIAIHDVVGAQQWFGKVSIEHAHRGDGKGCYNNSPPSIYLSWTSSGLLHFAQYNWTGGNNWGLATVKVIDNTVGNNASSPATYGGLRENHRWSKTLFCPLTNRSIVCGWFMSPNQGYQAFHLYEMSLDTVVRVAVNPGNGNWTTNMNNVFTMLSGSAHLEPNGNLFLFGKTHWGSGTGYGRIRRPRYASPAGDGYGGNASRTISDWQTIDVTGQEAGAWPVGSDGLCYPQGEHNIFYKRSDNGLLHWRTSRGGQMVNVGGTWGERAKQIKKSSGHWVPVASKTF